MAFFCRYNEKHEIRALGRCLAVEKLVTNWPRVSVSRWLNSLLKRLIADFCKASSIAE